MEIIYLQFHLCVVVEQRGHVEEEYMVWGDIDYTFDANFEHKLNQQSHYGLVQEKREYTQGSVA
jgi:hypothetical protein